MRPPVFRAGFDLLPDELVVDSFAGAGGASTGIEAAIGRPCDIAINHDAAAIAMHRANHPETKHFCESIWDVDPAVACAGRRAGLAWFSPSCTHFSRAKGAANPKSAEIRALADVVITWAASPARPRVILLENVEEFEDWGPLDEYGIVIKAQEGTLFRAWLAKLVDLGYHVEFRSLVAADYGCPTTRRRLFLVARCDGKPIVWPEATHGVGRAEPWRSAAEVIDWSLPCPSIFERKRPLAEATLQRIARGIERYVIDNGDPFIVPMPGEAFGSPFVVRHGHYSKRTGAGLREGCGAGTFRGQPLSLPLATVCATNDKHLVVPFIEKAFGGPNGHQTPGKSARSPLDTVTAKDHHRLAAAFITKYYGTSTGADVRAPLPTVTANSRGGGHLAEVRAFLIKYYRGGSPTQQLQLPLHTITTKARFGLVMVHGEPYHIVDIGLRMLEPSELFAAHVFPVDYDITPLFNGKPLTKTLQTKLVGNSVPPPMAEQMAHANLRCAA